ncbi:MAG: propionyl-CoA synthetase [Oceanococcaceae bacterium]
MNYHDNAERARVDPESFWAEQAQHIDWMQPWSAVRDTDAGASAAWFPGAQLNTCDNALDRHIRNGRGDQVALIADSAMTGAISRVTFAELRDRVARLAGVLTGWGVGRGDRVIIYMPMVPEAVMAMLACARIGAVHSVVFGGFAAAELAKRIDDAQPVAILTASCGLEPNKTIAYKPLLDAALERAQHRVANCLVLQREMLTAALQPGRDHDWHQCESLAAPVDCVPLNATDPLYILYTSGTTGKPKGVVRDNGGHAVAMSYSMRAVYGVQPGDVFWAASDVGWVVGHSYIVYAPLIHGCTTVLYEGKPVGTPDAGAFWRVIEQHRVNLLFTAPTALRAIKKEDPQGLRCADYDLSSLRHLFLAGERSDADTVHWAGQQLGVPVIDHWWQTELGWPAIANCVGLEMLPIKPGSSTLPVPGFDLAVVNDEGVEQPAGTIGNLVIRLPLPPGCLSTLWRNHDGYIAHYLAPFPGFYLTGDAGMIDADGYVWILSRIDDVINVAGHRLSTGGIEEILSAHPAVAECAVIGVADPLKGQVPVGLVVLKAGSSGGEVVAELVDRVRSELGAVACFRQAAVVPRLPKTRSGKVLRKTMRQIADGENPPPPATIDDPQILDEIAAVLGALGYATPREN